MRRGVVGRTVCLWVVALTGCAVHQDDWAREFGIALCQHEQECRRVSQSVDCTRKGYWNEWPEELDAVRLGLVGYSPSEARRCADLLAKVGCIDNLKSRLFHSTECRAAFPGRVAVGEPCMPAAVEVCGRDLKCELPTTQSVCGTCVPTGRAGEEVTNVGGKECGSGLYAVTDGGQTGPTKTGVCQPKSSIGEACSVRMPCVEWLDCSSVREVGTCVNAVIPPDAGAGEPGEGCRASTVAGRDWCAWPATCEDSRCVDRTARLGDSCTAATECELFGWCINGVCAAPAQAGESCLGSRCAAALACANDVCQSALSLCR